jgi:hypothetical protein
VSNPLHIHQIATRLIALHGPEARAFAANKADEMLAAGKLYERRTWRRVQEEVERAMGRDLLGDFPGLAAGLYNDTDVSDVLSNPVAPKTGALSTKWMSS